MADLSSGEICKLEKLLQMGRDHRNGAGYVLDFSDSSFTKFFNDLSVEIDSPKYTNDKARSSKAKKIRRFWEQDSNALVGHALGLLIDRAENNLANALGSITSNDERSVNACRAIADRLKGERPQPAQTDLSAFLSEDFSNVEIGALGLEGTLTSIIEGRLAEVQICLANGANLSAIFMAGSILEGLLLGEATRQPEEFNRAQDSPKGLNNRPKQFHEWTLANFIDVARELGILGEDISRFSHALRGFRNYIHPHQQMKKGFTPNEDTANLCVHVLLAAIRDLSRRGTK